MTKYAGIIAGSVLASFSNTANAEDIIAANTIKAGDALTSADIVTPNNADDLRRAINFVGMEASRTVYKGQTIEIKDLHEPTLIERNTIIQMEFNKGPLTILAEGRALDDGALGQRIRVMNLHSKRVVTAIVTGADLVRAQT